MERNQHTSNLSPSIEGLDFDKLWMVVKKNFLWIILILLVTNLCAYLTIRWTKDLFESASEMKLDIKRDATELGIKTIVEDQNLNIVSGEIEQIKSKLFFSKVIDSLDLWVSYYSIGKVLKDEMYKRSPFTVQYRSLQSQLMDIPIYFEFTDEHSYQIRLGEKGNPIKGFFNKPLIVGQSEFIITARFYELNDDNNYYFVVNSRNALLDYISRNINVDPLNFNANTIRISFQDNNALKAYDVVNKIDSIYIIYSNNQKNLANKQKIDWLNKELVQVEKRMQDFEDYFENFTLQNKSSDLTQDLKRTIITINKLDSQRYNLNKKIVELDELINTLTANKSISSIKQYFFLPTSINKKLEDLQTMTKERDNLSMSYNENTFAYKQKENEFNSLKDQIFTQLTDLKRQWFNSMSELMLSKERLEKEFIKMPDKNTEFSKNQRFYKLYEEFYLSMMQSKAGFEIAQAGTTPDFKILSNATMPTTPISPKKYMILGIGMILGIVLNFFFIGILYLANNRINSLAEVEKYIQVPVLGVVPTLRRDTNSLFHVNDSPKSMASEAIRTLRTNLDFFTSSGSKKVITISSTVSGEGKSFLSMNLSGVLAMSKKKVVLLDMDMRKLKNSRSPKVIDSSKGLSTILIKKNQWRECIQETEIPYLHYIPSGPHPPNPSELLMNGEFSTILEELKAEYDFVIMDTPPVGLVTDGIMAMKRSDLSIYVIRANYSKKEFINNLNRIVSVNKISNMAVVLNAIPNSGKTYGYGYYEEAKPQKIWHKIFRL